MGTKLAEAFVEISTEHGKFDSGMSHVQSQLQHASGAHGAMHGGEHEGPSAMAIGLAVEAFHQLAEWAERAYERVREVVGEFVHLNAEAETTEQRFANLMHSASRAHEQMEKLGAWAATQPFAKADIEKANLDLYRLGGAGLASMNNMKAFADAASMSGKSIGEVSSMMSHFYTALQQGTHGVDRFTRIMMTTGMITGETRRKIKEMADQGKTSKEIWEAVMKSLGRDGVAGAAERLSGTFTGLKTRFGNILEEAQKKIGKPLFDVAKTGLGKLVEFMSGGDFKTGVETATAAMSNFTDWLKRAFAGISMKDVMDVAISGFRMLGDVIRGMSGMIADVSHWATEMWNKMVPGSAVKDAIEGIKTLFDGIGVLFLNLPLVAEIAWKQTSLDLWTVIPGMNEAIASFVDYFTTGFQMIASIGDWLWGTLKAGWQESANFAEAIFAGLGGAFGSWIQTLVEAFDKFIDYFKQQWKNLLAGDVVALAKTSFTGTKDIFGGIGAGVGKAFDKGFDDFQKKLAGQKDAIAPKWDWEKWRADANKGGTLWGQAFKAIPKNMQDDINKLIDELSKREEELSNKREADKKKEEEDNAEMEFGKKPEEKEKHEGFIGIPDLSKKIQEAIMNPDKKHAAETAANTGKTAGHMQKIEEMANGAGVKVIQAAPAVGVFGN